MPTVGTTSRPGYVYDQGTDTWIPIGVGPHSHDTDYVTKSTIDAKGDLLAGSANDTVSRLAIGNNGETLVADSSQTTGLRWQGSYAAGKNVLINGGFDIWQRGTAASTTNNAYGADRWYAYTTTNVNYQRETLAVGSVGTYGIKYTSTSGTNSVLFGTALEDVVANQLRGQNVTLSFYAYCSTGTVSLISYIQKNSTANNATVGSWTTLSSPTNTVTTTPQRFTVSNVSIAADSTTAGIRILFGADNFTNGANFVIYGVQLEIGSVATAFTRAGGTLAGELAACQRYYFRINGGAAYYPLTTGGFSNTTTTILAVTPFPTEMRIAPTALEQTGTASNYGINESGGGYTCSAVPSFNAATKTQGAVQFTVASGLTVGRGAWGRNDNNSTAYLAWSAEL